jgi:hypothetical protein
MSFITVEYPQVLTPFDTIIAYTSTVVLITFSLSELSLEASLPLPCRPIFRPHCPVRSLESRETINLVKSSPMPLQCKLLHIAYNKRQLSHLTED